MQATGAHTYFWAVAVIQLRLENTTTKLEYLLLFVL